MKIFLYFFSTLIFLRKSIIRKYVIKILILVNFAVGLAHKFMSGSPTTMNVKSRMCEIVI